MFFKEDLIKFSRVIRPIIIVDEAYISNKNSDKNTVALEKFREFLVTTAHLTPLQFNDAHQQKLNSIISLFEFDDQSEGKIILDSFIERMGIREEIEIEILKRQEKKDRLKFEEIKKIAEKALEYSRAIIKKGSSHPECNDLPSPIYRISLGIGISYIKEIYENELDFLDPLKEVERFNQILQYCKKYSLGNCFEMALCALEYIIECSNLSATCYSIKDGDHVFLAINQLENCDVSDPSSWGKYAFICDPWLNAVYPASKYKTKLMGHSSMYKHNGNEGWRNDYKKDKILIDIHNYLIPLNFDSIHTLEPIKYFDTHFLRKRLDINNAKPRVLSSVLEYFNDVIEYMKNRMLFIETASEHKFYNNDTHKDLPLKARQLINKVQKIIDICKKSNYQNYSEMMFNLHKNFELVEYNSRALSSLIFELQIPETGWREFGLLMADSNTKCNTIRK